MARQIDAPVVELYGLTEEEVGVMENTDAQDSQINPLILPIRVLTPPTSPTTPRRI